MFFRIGGDWLVDVGNFLFYFQFENKVVFVYVLMFILGIRHLCIHSGVHQSQALSNSEQSCMNASEMDMSV